MIRGWWQKHEREEDDVTKKARYARQKLKETQDELRAEMARAKIDMQQRLNGVSDD